MSDHSFSEVCTLHRKALALFPTKVSLIEFLGLQADRLWRAHQERDGRVYVQITCWYPQLVGTSQAEILAHRFSREDARLTIAREYGFRDWEMAERVNPQAFNVSFENAVDAVVNGNLTELKELVGKAPELVITVSQFGHQATLLHYVAANGVETWRQKVPANAVEITQFLLERGANVNVHAQMYGGGQTTMALLLSSAHPKEAGLTEPIAKLLHAAGC